MRINMVLLLPLAAGLLSGAQPDIKDIIQKSVEANQRDFKADPHFNYKERDLDSKGDRTFQVTMIDGSPYSRLIAMNGKPLPDNLAAAEEKKEAEERRRRQAEGPKQRERRIEKYQRERQRDNTMMGQLTVGFNFALAGEREEKGNTVWVLRATPRPGYRPPNRDTEVLTGMQGELWIDQKTYQWVRVSAQVLRAVSIEGFLAQVQPGTRFELEKAPVGDGSVWLTSHFSERADAKVLYAFHHREREENTFWDYQPAK